MKKSMLILVLFFAYLFGNSQDVPSTQEKLHKQINDLSAKVETLKKENASLKKQQSKLLYQFNLLEKKLEEQTASQKELFQQTKGEVGTLKEDVNRQSTSLTSLEEQTDKSFANTDKKISRLFILGIIGIIALLIISVVLFFMNRKKIKNETQKLDARMLNNKEKIELEMERTSSNLKKLEDSLKKQLEKMRKEIDTRITELHPE